MLKIACKEKFKHHLGVTMQAARAESADSRDELESPELAAVQRPAAPGSCVVPCSRQPPPSAL